MKGTIDPAVPMPAVSTNVTPHLHQKSQAATMTTTRRGFAGPNSRDATIGSSSRYCQLAVYDAV